MPGSGTRSTYGGGGSFIVPLGDNGEKKRLDFWAKQAEPISADLLRIPGWLDEDPEREVLVQEGGTVRVVKARDRPRNVLFRIAPDRRTQEQWEGVLYRLRVEQSRRRTAQLHVRRAEEKARAAKAVLDQLIDSSQDPMFEARELARDAARRAREAPNEGERAAALIELEVRMEDAREISSRFRVERRHYEDALRMVDYWTAQAGAKLYPGLWAAINSFLDMQALSVASLASDEFTKKGARDRPSAPRVQSSHELTTDVT